MERSSIPGLSEKMLTDAAVAMETEDVEDAVENVVVVEDAVAVDAVVEVDVVADATPALGTAVASVASEAVVVVCPSFVATAGPGHCDLGTSVWVGGASLLQQVLAEGQIKC